MVPVLLCSLRSSNRNREVVGKNKPVTSRGISGFSKRSAQSPNYRDGAARRKGSKSKTTVSKTFGIPNHKNAGSESIKSNWWFRLNWMVCAMSDPIRYCIAFGIRLLRLGSTVSATFYPCKIGPARPKSPSSTKQILPLESLLRISSYEFVAARVPIQCK